MTAAPASGPRLKRRGLLTLAALTTLPAACGREPAIAEPAPPASRHDHVTATARPIRQPQAADSRSYGWPSAAGATLRPTTPTRTTIVRRYGSIW